MEQSPWPNLSQLKALCQAATPGPWTACPIDSVGGAAIHGGDGVTVADGFWDNDSPEPIRPMRTAADCDANTAFIAAARTAMPKLIEDYEALITLLNNVYHDDDAYIIGQLEWDAVPEHLKAAIKATRPKP